MVGLPCSSSGVCYFYYSYRRGGFQSRVARRCTQAT